MNAFNDIPLRSAIPLNDKVAGSQYLNNLSSLSVGAGVSGMRVVNGKGMWLGAKEFANAPFSVALNGTIRVTNGAGTVEITSEAFIFYNNGIPEIVIGDPPA